MRPLLILSLCIGLLALSVGWAESPPPAGDAQVALPALTALQIENALLERQVYVERIGRLQLEVDRYQRELGTRDATVQSLTATAATAAGLDPTRSHVDVAARAVVGPRALSTTTTTLPPEPES